MPPPPPPPPPSAEAPQSFEGPGAPKTSPAQRLAAAPPGVGEQVEHGLAIAARAVCQARGGLQAWHTWQQSSGCGARQTPPAGARKCPAAQVLCIQLL